MGQKSENPNILSGRREIERANIGRIENQGGGGEMFNLRFRELDEKIRVHNRIQTSRDRKNLYTGTVVINENKTNIRIYSTYILHTALSVEISFF